RALAAVGDSAKNEVCYLPRSTGAAMGPVATVKFVAGSAAIVAILAAVTPSASAADLLKLAAAQRGAWESAAPELGQSAGIFSKHGITLEVLYPRDGEVESAVASGSSDVGVDVGTIGVLRAFAKGARCASSGRARRAPPPIGTSRLPRRSKRSRTSTARPSLIGRTTPPANTTCST